MSYYSVGRVKENDIDYTYDLTPEGSVVGGGSGGSNNPNDPTVFNPVTATPGTPEAEVLPSYGSGVSNGPSAESPSIFKTPPPADIAVFVPTATRVVSRNTGNTQYYKKALPTGYQTPLQRIAAAVGLAPSKSEPTAIQYPAEDGGDTVSVIGTLPPKPGLNFNLGGVGNVKTAVIVGGLGLAAFLLYTTLKK